MYRKWILLLSSLLAAGVLLYFAGRAYAAPLVKSIFTIAPASQTADQQKTLASLEMINDHPFYRMTYAGNYSQFLELKKKYYWAMGIPKPHCSSISVLNPAGDALLGYNSDGEHRPLLLLYTSPSDGYASVSIIDIGESFGFDENHTPFDSDRIRSLLLYSPYYANTGMNEMGLAFSTMAEPSGTSSIDPAKPTTFASEIRRYVLDYVKDVDDAIALMSKYNVSYKGTNGSNVLLADRSRHSALVEWVDGSMVVLRNQRPWQVSTNFRVYGFQDQIEAYTAELQSAGKITADQWGKNYWRYITAWQALKAADGRLSAGQSMDLLSTVSLVKSESDKVRFNTQYSVVYNLVTGDFQVVMDRNYNQVYQYHLAMK